MISIREAGIAVMLQSLGPICSLLLVVFIAREFGVQSQGEFTVLKAWLDLFIVCATFGFSGSVTYVVNTHNLPKGIFLSSALTYGIAVILLLFGMLSFLTASFNMRLADNISLIYFSIAVGAAIISDLWRSILLTITDGILFSATVSLPPVLMLVSTMAFSWVFINPVFDLYFAISNTISVFVMLMLLGSKLTFRGVSVLKTYLFDLFKYGWHSFIQAIFIALAPLVTIWSIKNHSEVEIVVGLWGISALVYQATASPIAMIAPILFNRWSKGASESRVQQGYDLSSKLFMYTIPLSVVFAVVMYYAVPFIFGVSFSDGALGASLMLFGVPALFSSRVLAVLMFAVGDAKRLSIIFGVRLLLLVTILFAISKYFLNFSTSTYVAFLSLSWVFIEYLVAIISFVWVRGTLKES